MIERHELDKLRARIAQFASPFPAAPVAVRDDLIRLEYARLHALTPLLCLAIAANTLAMAVAVMGDLPLWQQVVPPAIILTAVIWHGTVWRRGGAKPTVATAIRKLGLLAPIAGVLGLVAGFWGVNAFVETEVYYCVVAPVFVGLAALVASNCLASVPRAAIAAMAGVLAPLVVKMLLFPNLGIRSMAVMLILIGSLQARLILSKFSDTIQMLVLQRDIARLAETDALTGLDNRRALTARIENELDRGVDVVLALIDLDGFKAVNDTHGHQLGDAMLVSVADRMTMLATDAISVARIGGDEFAIAFTVSGDAAHAQVRIEGLRAAIGLPCVSDSRIASVAASIGVARSPVDGATLAELMHAADVALYRDKRHRRQRNTIDLSRVQNAL